MIPTFEITTRQFGKTAEIPTTTNAPLRPSSTRS